MKFSDVLSLEIVDIVRDGLANGIDISKRIRDIDVVVDPGDEKKVTLSPGYIISRNIFAKG